jgi:pimeloyl-ACP methyl ester carboxylesterase
MQQTQSAGCRGPGLPMINEARRFERVLRLEQAFTVVYWDQRGCGLSLRRRQDRTGVSRERLVDDTVSLLALLHERPGAKTYVAGFSFGATLGAYAAAQQAPAKELVWFENSAHTPHLEEPGKFRDLLLRVRDSQFAKT